MYFEMCFKLVFFVVWNDVVLINLKENFELVISFLCVKYVNSGNKRLMMFCVLVIN